MKPPTTRAEQIQYRKDMLSKINASHFVASGECFSVADIASWLGTSHGPTASYLGDMVDMGLLLRGAAKPGAKTGALVYSRKPPSLLRRAWRKLSNAELGVEAVCRIGGAA